MGGKSKTPAPPDPYQTAGAQTTANQANASYLAALNRVNTYGPTGSSTYQNQGNDPTTGAPVYSQSTTLSPEQQGLYNSNTTNQLNQSGFAGNALNQARDAYQPINTNYDQQHQTAQDALYKQNTQYLDPQYKRDQESLDSKLAAEGAAPGSEAYKNSYDQFNEGKNQAYQSARTAASTGATQQTGQNIQQHIALQNQPLNYYNALMNGAQAQTPNANSTSPINTNPADVSGAINSAYGQNLNIANAQNQQSNSTTTGIITALATMFSDKRIKDDHGVIGSTPAGVPVHVFNYKGNPQPQVGVMAQEVQKTQPGAVKTHPSGLKMVDYSKVK